MTIRIRICSHRLLRDATRPARVLAWHCPLCRDWVPPRAFTLTTGTCRSCVRTGRSH